MALEELDSNDNDFIDKKLMKTVNKALSMFGASSTNRGIKQTNLEKSNKIRNLELNNVSDMLSKMLGKDLGDKEQMEFKLGLMELIDNLESKYIENAITRNLINKVLFALLVRFKAK